MKFNNSNSYINLLYCYIYFKINIICNFLNFKYFFINNYELRKISN